MIIQYRKIGLKHHCPDVYVSRIPGFQLFNGTANIFFTLNFMIKNLTARIHHHAMNESKSESGQVLSFLVSVENSHCFMHA